MFISKWSYVAFMFWCVISALIINNVSDDTMVIVDAIIFGSSAICFEIRMLREESEERGKK